MDNMTTQLITAVAVTDDKGLEKDRQYLFSLQVSNEGVIRIITTDDVEVYYGSIHDFLISWQKISSLGWANDKETFQKMLQELKGGAA
jgi:orotate phosphoribosyltransferase-like protein